MEHHLTGKNIGIAFLDTGIFPHMDFDDRILAFRDFIDQRDIPYDNNGHGTHTAGIAVGNGRAGNGRYRGVAPGASIISLKVLDQYGNGQKEVVLEALDWVLANKERYGIRIVNISVGTTENDYRTHKALIDAVDRVWDAGLVVVVAAGNMGPRAGSITAPGSSKKVITVGSSDMITSAFPISGRGPTRDCICKPDVVAPGKNIISCAIRPNRYVAKSGTSMSTPRVSGGIALLLEKTPRLTNVEIKERLLYTAQNLGLPHNQQGYGLFQLESFLAT
ncbi:MAG TPA: S8 family peptidase [Candidatus Pelethocola excrementipullorum]|nr:S8 family peptidase [Candidatus Pelethocola excrementipullorum]